MIKITQGFRLHYKIDEVAVMIIKKEGTKITINSSVEDDVNFIVATPEETSDWDVGKYRYQLQNADGIIDEGDFEVLANFALMDEDSTVKSNNEIILDAIEATLAGKATKAQSSMSVGDKSISYMSIAELLSLKDYFQKKVDDEKGIYSTINGGRLKYKFSMR